MKVKFVNVAVAVTSKTHLPLVAKNKGDFLYQNR